MPAASPHVLPLCVPSRGQRCLPSWHFHQSPFSPYQLHCKFLINTSGHSVCVSTAPLYKKILSKLIPRWGNGNLKGSWTQALTVTGGRVPLIEGGLARSVNAALQLPAECEPASFLVLYSQNPSKYLFLLCMVCTGHATPF